MTLIFKNDCKVINHGMRKEKEKPVKHEKSFGIEADNLSMQERRELNKFFQTNKTDYCEKNMTAFLKQIKKNENK